MRYACFCLWYVLSVPAQAQSVQIKFDVIFNDKIIGVVTASEEKHSDKIVRDLKTNTDAKIMIMSVHVESEVSASHHNGVMERGIAFRHANRGTEDVHASTVRDGNHYKCDRNGVSTILDVKEITFSVVDLYFEEPTGRTSVYSTMYGTFVPIKMIYAGRYYITNPDGKKNTYHYTEGKLMTIEATTPLGTVVSRREIR